LSAAARDILHGLADLGAKVDRQGDKLMVRAGTAPVPKDILGTLREHKAEILQALSADTKQDDTEASAAVIEPDHRVSLAWTEGFARLDPDRPPGDVPPNRWQQFINDVRLFLSSPFCAVAVALGWGPHDLFGCDPDRPFARIDQAGLLWLLKGDRLIALSENTARMETPTGARQTFCRRAGKQGRVLAWELP
jgi:hypothetical protein